MVECRKGRIFIIYAKVTNGIAVIKYGNFLFK